MPKISWYSYIGTPKHISVIWKNLGMLNCLPVVAQLQLHKSTKTKAPNCLPVEPTDAKLLASGCTRINKDNGSIDINGFRRS